MFGRLLSPLFVLGMLARPCLAQAPDPPPPQSATPRTSSSLATTPTVPAKKVWTNDNVSGAKGSVSVVGDKQNQKYPMDPNRPADPATVARIKKDLEKLQSQLEEVNKKLKAYKEFQEGEAVSKGERDMSKAYSRVPVDQQMTQLLEKKKELEGQLGDLSDEARKKGVAPGDLR
jgi:hypothetical protein